MNLLFSRCKSVNSLQM